MSATIQMSHCSTYLRQSPQSDDAQGIAKGVEHRHRGVGEKNEYVINAYPHNEEDGHGGE